MKARNIGFTLIESVVVIAILGIMALVGSESILEFQKNALLDSTANEIASTLRSARTKSLAGQLCESGETLKDKDCNDKKCDELTAEDFKSDYLPKYGVDLTTSSYSLFRQCWLSCDTEETIKTIENFTLPANFSLDPVGQIIFSRVNGETTPIILTLTGTNGKERKIEINNQGVSVEK